MSDLYLMFGAMADPIHVQIIEQSITIDRKETEQAQKDANAIARLMIRGLIGDSEARKVRQRIIRNLSRKASR